MTVARLRAELSARGLDSSVHKATLVDCDLTSQVVTGASANYPESAEREAREPTVRSADLSQERLRSSIVPVRAETLPTLLAAFQSQPAQTTSRSARCPTSCLAAAQLQLAQNTPTVSGGDCIWLTSPGVPSCSPQPSAVPTKLLDRITAGEFVKFSELLPPVACSHSFTRHSSSVNVLQLGSTDSTATGNGCGSCRKRP